MTIQIIPDYKYKYYISAYSDTINGQELVTEFRKFIIHHSPCTFAGEMIDMSHLLEPNVTYNELNTYAHTFNDYYKTANIGIFYRAIYTPCDLTFGIARMIHTLADDSVQDVKIFRDRDEAEAWLHTKLGNQQLDISA